MTRRATGPVTAAGKAISAQNARRHGLSAEPAADLVRAWFNVILDNPADTYEEPDADTPRREAALRLAIAEARYHRALDKLQTHATRAKFRAGAGGRVSGYNAPRNCQLGGRGPGRQAQFSGPRLREFRPAAHGAPVPGRRARAAPISQVPG